MLPIVIVDDSEEDLLLLKGLIGRCRILNPVHLCRSGKACLDYFVSQEGKARQVILLLDLVMQPIDGLGVLRELNSGKALRHSFVIMVSGMSDIRKMAEAYQLGAKTFMIKPIEGDDLMQVFRSLKGLLVRELPEGNRLELESNQMLLKRE